ncbi:MAG: phytoene/squalene synthase family protein [Halococcoides sp.]
MSSDLPDGDREWCHEAVQDVSRTFALTVEVLDEPMATRICVGYLLCRVADTIEDAGHIPPEEQRRLLACYEAAIDPDDATTMPAFRDAVDDYLPPAEERNDDWRVLAKASTIWATFQQQPESVRAAIRPSVREMVDGMAEFVDRHADSGGLRIADREELEEYCHYAAGTVGTLVTRLLTRGDVNDYDADRMAATSEEFGLLLQLINVAKDVHDDFREENNVYLPTQWLAEEGIDPDEVLDPANRESAARVVRRTADHAAGYLDDAQTYLEAMPLVEGNTLAAWGVPYLLGVGTLRELRDRPADALTGRGVKVDREEVFAVVAALEDAADRDILGELRSTIAEQPLHHAPLEANQV